MSEEFDNCARNGGKIRTKKLKNNKYIRTCYDKDGNSYTGEVMDKKKKSKAKKFHKRKGGPKDLNESLLGLKKYYDECYHN